MDAKSVPGGRVPFGMVRGLHEHHENSLTPSICKIKRTNLYATRPSAPVVMTYPITSANFYQGGSVNATIWAEIEGGTGIICACLPALRAPALKLYRYCTGESSNDTASRSRQYSEFHEIDKTTGSHYDADGNKFDKTHGIFNNTPPNRKSKVIDPWGDAIPLSTAQATATRGRTSDDDSDERVMGITKTVDFNVSNV